MLWGIFSLILIIAIDITLGGLFIWLGTRVVKVQNTSFKKSIIAAVILNLLVLVIINVPTGFQLHFNIFNYQTFLILLLVSYFIIKVLFKTTLKQSFRVLLFNIISLALAFPLIMLGEISLSFLDITRKETKMQNTDVYKSVLETMALYCQSLPIKENMSPFGNAWMPQVVYDLKPNWVSIRKNDVLIEFGGGFYHYGYVVRKLSEETKEDKDTWCIEMEQEDKPNKLLDKLTLNHDKKINKDEWISEASVRYLKQIMAEPKEIRNHQERFLFLLFFASREEACKSAKASMEIIPEHWWPRLIYAITNYGLGNDKPTNEYKIWVENHQNFSNWIYLYALYKLERRTEESLNIIEKAMPLRAIETPYDGLNTSALAYTAALYAYKNNYYDLAIRICKKMEIEEVDEYTKKSIQEGFHTFACSMFIPQWKLSGSS